MSPANRHNSTSRSIPLSNLFNDPALRMAFRRAEDSGLDFSITFAMPPHQPRTLNGGAVAERVLEEVA